MATEKDISFQEEKTSRVNAESCIETAPKSKRGKIIFFGGTMLYRYVGLLLILAIPDVVRLVFHH